MAEHPLPERREADRAIDPALALLLVAHCAVWVMVLAIHPPRIAADDVARFAQIAAEPGVAYRDFPSEYMPLETLFIRLTLSTDVATAAVQVIALSAMCHVVTLLLIRSLFGRGAGIAYLWFALPMQVFMLFRLDLVAVVLVLTSLALCRRGHPRIAGTVFAAAILFKLWPLVLIPLLVGRGGRRAGWTAVAVLGIGAGMWVAVGGVDGVRYVTSFRGATGWQIESTIGAITALVSDEVPRFESGTIRVGQMAGWALLSSRVLTIVFVVAAWWKARDSGVETAGLPSAAVVSIVVAFAPVASAQYVAWLLPWCAVAVVEFPRRVVAVATAGAATLAAAAFLVFWDIAGGMRTLEMISFVRALCVLAIPLAWFVEPRRVAGVRS